jgi:hypothetical protein
VSDLFLLDEGVLSLVTNPRSSARARACAAWLRGMLAAGARVMVPGVAEYELRRELIRADKAAGDRVVVVTTNVGHLGRFVEARRWEDLPPPE